MDQIPEQSFENVEAVNRRALLKLTPGERIILACELSDACWALAAGMAKAKAAKEQMRPAR